MASPEKANFHDRYRHQAGNDRERLGPDQIAKPQPGQKDQAQQVSHRVELDALQVAADQEKVRRGAVAPKSGVQARFKNSIPRLTPCC